MSRADIAHEIAFDLLEADALDRHNYGYDDNALKADALDRHNYGYDDNALIAHVQNIILEHLENYLLISGTIIM